LQDYSAAAVRAIRPAAPQRQILTPDAGPRITLPGPALPRELNSLAEAGLRAVRAEAPRLSSRSARSWLVSAMVTVTLMGVLFIAMLYSQFRPATKPGEAPAAVEAAAPDPVDPPPVAPVSYSLSKAVEVTGFRLVSEANKKPEIHFLVVNHSAANLSNVTVYVTLRASAAKPGQAPLSRFSFRAPKLGPLESQELVSFPEKLPRTSGLPEWQDLRADIELSQ
jgi:hypothetical protein